MFDFQILRDAYLLKNGIKEDHSLETTEDLDDLYSKIRPEDVA